MALIAMRSAMVLVWSSAVTASATWTPTLMRFNWAAHACSRWLSCGHTHHTNGPDGRRSLGNTVRDGGGSIPPWAGPRARLSGRLTTTSGVLSLSRTHARLTTLLCTY